MLQNTPRYRLSKTIKKTNCPYCGRWRCFRLYEDTETGEALDPEVGRCDHENTCPTLHYSPSDYFRDHPEKRNYDPDRTTYRSLRPVRTVIPPPPRPINGIPSEYVDRSRSEASVFVEAVLRKVLTPDGIARALENYRLGATRRGEVIFWQIDRNGVVRTGKIMAYDHNGHRIGNPDWVHNKLKNSGTLPGNWELTQCLFGEHLLALRPNDKVCVVESEKTAVICSEFYNQFVWLATGGCKGLNEEKMKVLIGRDVTIFPDSGEYDSWNKKMKEFSYSTKINYHISDDLEMYVGNTDLADIIMGEAKLKKEEPAHEAVKHPKDSRWEVMKADNPNLQTLEDLFGLEPI